MAFFKETDEILNYVIGEKILQNQNLCKLLYYYSDTSPLEHDGEINFNFNPLEQPDIKNTRDLLMNNIFPLPKKPDLTTKQTGFMTVVLSGGERHYNDDNDGYRRIFLIFDIVVHLNQWIIEDSFRAYKIAEELDKMFNDKNIDIVGKVNYINFKQRDYSTNFYGLQLIYDFSINSNIECNPKSKVLQHDISHDLNSCHPSFLPKNIGNGVIKNGDI